MKKISYTLLLFLAMQVAYLCAEDSPFKQAVRFYAQNEYTAAQQLFENITPKHGVIWYNLGNCYYKQGKLYAAYACWLRSLRTIPVLYRGWALRNIAYQASMLPYKQDTSLYDYVLSRVWHVLSWIPLLIWQLMLLCAWYFFCWYARGWFRRKRYLLLTVAVCVIGMLFTVTISYQKKYTEQAALVMDCRVYMHTGPDEQFHTVGPLCPGEILSVHTQEGDWYKVSTQAAVGWCKGDHLMVL